MASETTTTGANDVYLAAALSNRILAEARPYDVCRPFFRREGKSNSSAMDFPIQADPGAAGASYTEGTGLSNTALTTDKATATAVATGMMATVTDELVENASVISAIPHFAGVLGRSVAERFETDATALLDDFSNTTGTAGVPTSYADLLAAVNAIAQRDLMGTVVGVLDPAQIGNVYQDVGTSGAALFANPGSGSAALQDVSLEGFAFQTAGANWYQTSLVTSSGGGVFLTDHALGLYEIRPLRLELQRIAELPGTKVVQTTRYGMVEVRDAAGQTLVSA